MRHFLHILIGLLLLSSTTSMLAQDKNMVKANKEFDNFAFIDARKAYLEIADNGFYSEELLKRLGDSYYFTADYVPAATWYGELYKLNDAISADYLYRYAQSLKSSGQYEASDALMEEFHNRDGNDLRGSLFVKERNYLAEIEARSGTYELTPFSFNSQLSDFSPSFYLGSLLFASNRLVGKNVPNRIHEWNNQPFLDLYRTPTDTTNGAKVKSFNSDVNTKFHESTPVSTRDGQTIYFTRNNYTDGDYKQDSDGTNKLKLYRAKRNEDGKWDITEVPFNSDEYSVAHPALSPDEKTLYFASDKPGGKGMSDLYKVSLEGDGYGTPETLGDKVNTEFRETFPFVSADNKLYFASDGHPGLGGLDVFVSDITDKGFGAVYNLGRPINSLKDDFTFIVNSKTGMGYFASNRDGGLGDDDIYSFRKLKESEPICSQMVTGVVVDKDSRQPISNAKVVLMDAANQVITQLISGEDGAFSFPLDCNMGYCVRGSKINYGFDEECFTTTAELELNLQLTLELENLDAPKLGDDLNDILDLEMIYFDLDKDFIRADAQLELNKVVKYMRKYPNLKIDVRSHTDSRNTDAYNKDLSTRRNVSTIAYLVDKGGISSSRLTGRGYGESELTNHCSDGVSCSEALHQLNRRSEFIIVNK